MSVSLVASNHVKGQPPISCNITISGENKLSLMAGLVTGNTGDPGSLTATLGGNAPTGIIFNTSTNTYYRSFMFYWINPSDGEATAQIISANTARAWFMIGCFNGVNQSVPFGTLKTGNALALTGIACNIGDLIVDLLTGNQDLVTGTKDATWTDIRKDYLYTSANYGNGNTSYKVAISTSESSTWTGLTNVQLHNAIPIIEASGDVGEILIPTWIF